MSAQLMRRRLGMSLIAAISTALGSLGATFGTGGQRVTVSEEGDVTLSLAGGKTLSDLSLKTPAGRQLLPSRSAVVGEERSTQQGIELTIRYSVVNLFHAQAIDGTVIDLNWRRLEGQDP